MNKPSPESTSYTQEDVIRYIEGVLAQAGQNLNDVGKIVLGGMWQGCTYEEIGEQNPTYRTQTFKQAGSELLRLLSEVMGVDVNKWTFRTVIEKRISPIPVLGETLPAVRKFYGRVKELAALQEAVTKNRLTVLYGSPGIGKTALAAKLVQSLSLKDWDCVVWKSVNPLPEILKLQEKLLQYLTEDGKTLVIDNQSPLDLTEALLDKLKARRILLILDSAELMESQEYQAFLRKVIVESHQSSILLTSERPFNFIERWCFGGLNCKLFLLKDLDFESSMSLLRDKGLTDESEWDYLIRAYGANPLILEIIANGILNLFGGRVSQVIELVTTFYTDSIESLLQRQFKYFGDLEKQVMYCLASHKEPLSFPKILEQLPQLSSSQVVRSLDSLDKHSLLVKSTIDGQPTYFLNSIVRKHALNTFSNEKLTTANTQ